MDVQLRFIRVKSDGNNSIRWRARLVEGSKSVTLFTANNEPFVKVVQHALKALFVRYTEMDEPEQYEVEIVIPKTAYIRPALRQHIINCWAFEEPFKYIGMVDTATTKTKGADDLA